MYQQTLPQTGYSYYPQQQYRPPATTTAPPQIAGLKGRPVSSLDEVRAAAVDFDGSISYFPNLANDKIYTKQINLDGTSSVRVYELSEIPATPTTQPVVDNLVTKEEFTQTINGLLEEIAALKAPMVAAAQSNVEQAQPTEGQPQGFNF